MPKSYIRAGNINLKGKKSKLMGCKCCEVLDLRGKYNDRLMKKEMRGSVSEWTILSDS